MSGQERFASEEDERAARLARQLAEAKGALRRERAQRQRLEAQLKRRELDLNLLIDSIPLPVAITTPTGEVEALNRATLDYFGKTLDELKGWTALEVVHPEDLDRTVAAQRAAHVAGVDYNVESRHRRADGVYRWFNVLGLPFRDSSGRILRWFHLQIDIDERKRAEEALSLSELNARLLVDNIPAFVSTLSPQGHLEAVNQQLVDYTGRSLDELQQWPKNNLFHADDLPRALDTLHNAVETGAPFDTEIRIRRSDGVYRWFQIRGFAPRDANGEMTRWYVLHADIDDRKRAEQALARSERDLKLNIDTIPVLTWSARQDGTDFHYNKHYLDYVGLPADEIRGRRWTKQIHPDDLAGLLAAWDAALDAGIAGEAEARLQRHDGVYRWFLFRVNPLRDEAGEIVKWYGVNIDIEDRKQAEAELIRASQHLNEAQQLSRTGSYIVDLGKDVHVCSDEFYRICGFEIGSTITRRALAEIVVAEDMQALAVEVERAIAGSQFDFEFRIRTKAGALRHLHGIARRISVAPVFAGSVTDVTERREAEANLRRTDGFLAKAQELSLTGSFSWNSAAPREFTWSTQMYRLYELPLGTPITAELLQERYHSDDRPLLQEALKRARRGEVIDYEHRIVFPDGRIKHAHVFASMAPKGPSDTIEYFGAVQDVTQRRQGQEALDKVRAELAHAARVMSLGTLTASIAHEVNQPLSGIVTNASTCMRMLATDPPNIDGALETARRTIRDGNRASEVISRLRALFSKKDFAAEPVDLNSAAREVIALSWQELQRHGVALQVSFDDDVPPLTGDRVQLQQVIINLVLNAADAMKEVTDRPRQMTIATARGDDGSVRLSVRDAGVGVPGDAINKLFDAFYTTKANGMGIGLSVSRSIIERHNGRLWASQNDDHGATFSFSIPCEAPR